MPKSPRSPSSSGKNLTLAQKQQILACHEEQKANNPSYFQKDLSTWAKDTFNLNYLPSKATIYRILNQDTAAEASPSSSRKLPSNLEHLDNLLADWVHTQQDRGVMVNGHMLKVQGQILQTRLNTQLPPHQQLSLKFSNGWMQKFKSRHSFAQHIAHGESGSVNQQTVDQELPLLKQVLQQYKPEDIFNADETGLFFSMPPTRTISTKAVHGLKKNKTRITVLFACMQLNRIREVGALLHWQSCSA